MIRRAIVEEIIDPYLMKVRIPEVDRTKSSSTYVDTEDLEEMTVCVQAGITTSLNVGDIVIVSYDKYAPDEAVILGCLFREGLESFTDAKLNELIVFGKAELTKNTKIGDISYNELSSLSGVKDNVQKQLNDLQEQLNLLKKG